MHLRVDLALLLAENRAPRQSACEMPCAQVHVAGGAHVVEHAQRGEEADVLKGARDAARGDLCRA